VHRHGENPGISAAGSNLLTMLMFVEEGRLRWLESHGIRPIPLTPMPSHVIP
jgi:hypothetical protein